MGAHHRRKGAEIAPAQQQLSLLRFIISKIGVAADIAVMQTMAVIASDNAAGTTEPDHQGSSQRSGRLPTSW